MGGFIQIPAPILQVDGVLARQIELARCELCSQELHGIARPFLLTVVVPGPVGFCPGVAVPIRVGIGDRASVHGVPLLHH